MSQILTDGEKRLADAKNIERLQGKLAYIRTLAQNTLDEFSRGSHNHKTMRDVFKEIEKTVDGTAGGWLALQAPKKDKPKLCPMGHGKERYCGEDCAWWDCNHGRCDISSAQVWLDSIATHLMEMMHPEAKVPEFNECLCETHGKMTFTDRCPIHGDDDDEPIPPQKRTELEQKVVDLIGSGAKQGKTYVVSWSLVEAMRQFLTEKGVIRGK